MVSFVPVPFQLGRRQEFCPPVSLGVYRGRPPVPPFLLPSFGGQKKGPRCGLGKPTVFGVVGVETLRFWKVTQVWAG